MVMNTPLRDDGQDDGVRQRILAAARVEFAAHGLAAASVRTLAERAGVTAAMINYYFGGKAGLHDAVVAEAQARLYGRLAAVAGCGEETGSIPVRLALAYFDFLVEERDLQRILLRQVLDQGGDPHPRAPDWVAPLRQLLATHFSSRADAVDLALSLFGAISAYFIYQPVLGSFLGEDPLGRARLAARRRHVAALVSWMERNTPC